MILNKYSFELNQENVFSAIYILQYFVSISNQLLCTMGIQGLLKNVKPCMKQMNMIQYQGQKAAVDTYAWLHKIIKGPSGKQIISGKDPERYVADCLRRIDKLTMNGIDIIMVFDGSPPPRKANQQQVRRKRREQNFEKGKQLIQAGQTEKGLKKMIDSIDITPDIAFKLIQELENKEIKYIIAPYEADAQLAYLNREGIVDFIITEDSDLLAFGAKKIVYKLDFSTMLGEQIKLEDIKNTPAAGFNWFTHNMFLSACIMAGCDYLDQIKGVGMKMAQKVISKHHTVKKALSEIAITKKIPEGYEENFMKAMLTFRFQKVYCPIRRICVSVNDFDTKKWHNVQNLGELIGGQNKLWEKQVFDAAMLQYAQTLSMDQTHSDWQFLGKKLTTQMAQKVCEGKIHPINFGQYDQNCLQKLRYNKVINIPHRIMSKKSSQSAPNPIKKVPKNCKNSIMNYVKPIQRINALQYRSIKNRIVNQEQYIMIENQESSNSRQFIANNFPIHQVNKKKLLKFNDKDSSSEEEEQYININQKSSKGQESKIQSIDLISEAQNSQNLDGMALSSDKIIETKCHKSEKSFRNRLEQISQLYFGQIFSQQFLNAPFK